MLMTLDEILLQKLSEWHPPPGRQDLSVADPASGWAVTLTADQRDVLGCLVWELTVRRTTSATEGSLQAWADRVAARTTGLVEPLTVVEVDTLRDEALLRSNEPSQRGQGLYYYEILLKGTREALVRRYQASHQAGDRREQIAFALTYEVLANLVWTLTAA
jgi:hypothetical protein